jgi:hypothetical protein
MLAAQTEVYQPNNFVGYHSCFEAVCKTIATVRTVRRDAHRRSFNDQACFTVHLIASMVGSEL